MIKELSKIEITIPMWEALSEAADYPEGPKEPFNALEKFVFDNEPAGETNVKEFREGLAAVLKEVIEQSMRASNQCPQIIIHLEPKQ